MTTRPRRRRPGGGWEVTTLEPRGLPDAGMAAAAQAVLLDMGSVSRGAALVGAEATAHIDPGDSVTFRFALEAAGDYTLNVRHDGDGLALMAVTPAGPAAIDPGPAGPTRGIPLELVPGVYEVTASAAGGRPVFVDWDLLLNTGVARADVAATHGVVLALPPTAPGPTSPAAPSPGGSSPPVAVVPADPASPAQSLAYPLAGPMMGRPRLDPPPQAGAAHRPDPEVWSSRPSPAGRVQDDVLRTTLPAGVDDLATVGPPGGDLGAAAPTPASEPVAAGAGSDPTPLGLSAVAGPASQPWPRPALLAPGLCVGVVIAARVHRARRRAAPSNPRDVVRQLLEQVG